VVLLVKQVATEHFVLYSSEVYMFRHALGVALLACATAIASAGGGVRDDVQNIIPGIDTLPPQVQQTAVTCTTVELLASEIRNTPEPPADPPGSGDQIDRGIASITINGSPASVNARLILITDTGFPKDPSYKEFAFRIEPIDPSKRAIAYVWIRDWAGNVAGREVIIEPKVPTPSTDAVTVETRANTTVDQTITLTNTTSEPQTISSITLSNGQRFEIISGGTSSTIVLGPGETREIIVRYAPDLSSENGDQGTILITTPCGNKQVALSGTGLVGKLLTEDWDAGTQNAGVKVCKAGGFVVENRGTASVTITGFTSSNPNVTVNSAIDAANPYTLNPGENVAVTELCYERASAGIDTATVSVVCNAETGDAECIVFGKVITTSVDDEDTPTPSVWYDASADRVRFPAERTATLIDVNGHVVGMSNASLGWIDTRGLASGAYILVMPDEPQRTTRVMITR